MSVFPILMRLRLKGLFGINAALKTRDPDKKRKAVFRVIGIAVLGVFLFGSMFTSFSGVAYFMKEAGQLEAVLPLGAVAGTAMMLLTCVVSGGTALFGSKDHETLLSMPIPSGTVILYREYSLYLYLLLFAFYTFMPAVAAYAVHALPAWWFYLLALLALLLLPVPALVVGCALGVGVGLLLARVRGKNVIKTALYIVLLIGVMLIYTTDLSEEALAQAMSSVAGLAERIYPPAVWIGDMLSGGSPIGFIAFAALSIALLWGFTSLAGRASGAIHARMTAVAAGRKYRIRELKSAPAWRALFTKELRRFLASPLYMMNTSAGLVMLIILAVVYALKGGDSLNAFMGGIVSIDSALPAMLTFFVGMSSTTAASISLEARALQQLVALPVRGRDVVNAKCLVNLVTTVPAVLVSATVLTVFGGLSPATAVMLYLVPIAFALFTSVVGLALNVAMPKLDWKNEQQVIKQGGAVGFSILIGFGAAGLTIAAALIINSVWVYVAAILAVLTVTAILYRSLTRRIIKKLVKIEG